MKKIDPEKLRRKKQEEGEEEESGQDVPVSAGAVDKVIDLAFNPSREKIREVTIIDRIQGRLFPLLDVVNKGQLYILEVSTFRKNKEEYKRLFEKRIPVQPNFLDEYMFRTAQWQKSVAGKNLERAIDIALAETETRTAEQEDPFGGSSDAYRD